MAIADKLAGAMVPSTDQSSVRRRWGIIKTISTNGTVSVDVAGVIVNGVKRLSSYQPTVGERVQLDVVGTDMVVSGATAPSPRAFRRPIGDIEPTLRKTPKPDTLFLDGTIKNRSGVGGYPELWAWVVAEGLHNGLLFGNGNGSTTFQLPNFCGRIPIGAGVLGADTYNLGLLSGVATQVLTTAQMPAHTHSVAVGAHAAHAHSVQVAAHVAHTHSVSVGNHGNHYHSINSETGLAGGNHGNHNSGTSNVTQVGSGVTLPANYSVGNSAHSHPINTDTSTESLSGHSVTQSTAGPTTHSVTETTGGPTTHTVTETSVGGSTPVDVRQPSIAVNWLIWV